jgi:peptidoglycan hydrolase-like protein with peptidoglycan-binding domain
MTTNHIKQCAAATALALLLVPGALSALTTSELSGLNSGYTRDLQIGMKGEDVRKLQKYLNANGYLLANVGDGSPGFETTMFCSLTRAALITFQKAKGISPAAGYFGPKTRAYVASH